MRPGRSFLRLLLPLVAAVPAAAQCVVDNPGGSKVNINRPVDADVPEAGFEPVTKLNQQLPRWICFTAGYRARLESYSAGNFQPGNSDTYLLTRFRLGTLIKPTSWLGAYFELQDADAFWKKGSLGPPYQSTWDLRRAYVDFGDIEEGFFSLRVGRQDLAFGHLRLVGTSYWRNASRGYDAARMVFHRDWLRVNGFVAAPVISGDNGLSHHQPGNIFDGIYTVLENRIPSSTIEPYVLWRLTPGLKVEQGGVGKLDEKTTGVRWAGNARNFDYDAETAGQFGHIGPDPLRAWAWSAVAGYTFESARLRPRIFVKYDFASGDRNPKDGVHGTFDQLYPNIHDHHGLADVIAWQNLKSVRSGVRVSLRRNWIVASAYNDWWLASANDAFYNASGSAVARDPAGMSGTHIGREFDLQTSHRLNRNLELGAGVGYIRSGDFLLRTHHAASYLYPYVMAYYNVF
ncbi:MAG TPA: alginate export family protein [Bryobacteraceae bacterium]|nr:alginate export family protein [Bryobacteraceae bacterium]